MKTILFVSYDFKFLYKLIEHYKQNSNYKILIDKWDGHENHNYKKSLELLDKCDIIFCEWALQNAVWYSKHKKKNQKLFIRLHRFEMNKRYLSYIYWYNVDKIIFISPKIKQIVSKKYDHVLKKSMIIYNYTDMKKYNLKKNENHKYNIGLLGWGRKLKRPDLALKIFKMLKNYDKRYKLYLKGEHPYNVKWIKEDKEEYEYFKVFFKEIKDMKDIYFEKVGENVPEWLQNIGIILSTSDVEASHQAITEGMASGCIPFLTGGYVKKYGANNIYPSQCCYKNITDVVKNILKINKSNINREMFKDAVEKYDIKYIFKQFDNLILQ
jgi:hypothetical protein